MNHHVLVSETKGEIELQAQQLPEPGDHEIQVRVHASLISPGTERAFVLGMANTSGDYPMTPGYSSAGEVVKVGKAVTDFRVGDRIASHGIQHRSYGNIRQARAARIPDGVPYELAAFTSLGVIAMQGVRKARIELGESAMVIGLGIIGQLAMQLAKLNGAVPVIGVDREDNRIELARHCGVELALNSADGGWTDAVRQATEGKGPQVVIESTGVPEVINTALGTARDFGRAVILSSTRGDTTVNFYRDVHKKALTIIGAHISGNAGTESRPGFWTWRDDANAFLNLLCHNRVLLEPLITERVHWTDIEQSYREMLAGNANKIGTIIHWE
ncbi:2-desacetyl-2-hydroxyethyl bacteriochlorophyllide A dehydrogenase [Paenibacillus sp. UNC496MF]|uniref:zinc-dependent alcohol dehydrogenase n=1 Tax=Paenibacillus sp. UNC496MF TaxID=1502753 RepID=UPI0008E57DC7|nr:zinc-binding alcohol dehydrogenase [Paenibacillus sp. UNC496MF]SFJ82634.1 2-desacetyl-2-hydroxyethyl bacteriochlorophyllide A dehydrogenase [Paenibacillus sp. UNC496MF]